MKKKRPKLSTCKHSFTPPSAGHFHPLEEPNGSRFVFVKSFMSTPEDGTQFHELNDDDVSVLVDYFKLLARWSREEKHDAEDD